MGLDWLGLQALADRLGIDFIETTATDYASVEQVFMHVARTVIQKQGL